MFRPYLIIIAIVAALGIVIVADGVIAADYYYTDTKKGQTYRITIDSNGYGVDQYGNRINKTLPDLARVTDDCGTTQINAYTSPDHPIFKDKSEIKEDAIEEKPKPEIVKDANYYYNLAEADYKVKNYDSAINNFQKAIELGEKEKKDNVTLGMYHNRLGDSNFKINKFKKSKLQYEIAIKLNPKDADAHGNLEYLYANIFFDKVKAKEYANIYLKLKNKIK